MPRDESFGQLLRRYRDDAGLSQEALGEKVGLSRKTIQSIEGHRGRPHIKDEVAVVTKMAIACGVKVGDLSFKLGWVPLEEAQGTAWEKGLTEEAKRAVVRVADLLRAKSDEPPEAMPGPRRAARS